METSFIFDSLAGTVSWLVNAGIGVWEVLWDLIQTQPIAALVIVVLIVIFGFLTFNWIVNTSWTFGLYFIAFLILIAIAISVYVGWTQYNIGEWIVTTLNNFFTGGT